MRHLLPSILRQSQPDSFARRSVPLCPVSVDRWKPRPTLPALAEFRASHPVAVDVRQRSGRPAENTFKPHAARRSGVPSLSVPGGSAAVSLASLLVSFWVLQKTLGTEAAFFLLGIIAVHESGHFIAARRFGVPVLWPVFMPWVGACVVMLEPAKDARVQAWIGLAGPLAGVAATALLHISAVHSESLALLEIAAWGYTVHLLNLIPAGSLDGGHVAGFVGRWLWLPGALVLALTAFYMEHLPWYGRLVLGLMLVSAICRAAQVLAEWTGLRKAPEKPAGGAVDHTILWLLFATLGIVCLCGSILAKEQIRRIEEDLFSNIYASREQPPVAAAEDFK